MTDDDDSYEQYYDRLTNAHRDRLGERADRYRERLAERGYEVTVAESDGGFFAGVLVIDDEQGRFGFLEANGSVSWIGGDVAGIGALGAAVAQNPNERLDRQVEGLEHADVE